MAYITFKNINKSFGSLHVLKGINLEVEKGELLTLLGPSGCGKSTLLRCLAGLEEVQEGQIFLEDRDITNLDARLRQIGMVFQQYSLFPNMTVEQNLAFGLKIQKLSKEQMKEEITKALKMIGMEDKVNAYPSQLSGGQQQRVALARTLAQNPQIILADEPVASLDPVTARQVMDDFQRINQDMNITVIINIHHVELALQYASRVVGIREGRIVYDGPASKVDQEILDSIYQGEREEATA